MLEQASYETPSNRGRAAALHAHGTLAAFGQATFHTHQHVLQELLGDAREVGDIAAVVKEGHRGRLRGASVLRTTTRHGEWQPPKCQGSAGDQ